MKTAKTLALALAALAAAPLSARADDPIVLRFAYPAPPQGRANVWGFTPWAKEVNQASGGAVEVKIFPGAALGDYRNVYDRTINAVVDLSYGILGPISSDFPKSMVTTLPFESDDVEVSSLAFWRIYANGTIADEYNRVRLLALFDFSDSGIHTRKPIKTAADLRGLKLSVGTRVLGEMVEKLGATAVQLQPTDYYQSMQRGLVEGITTSWPAVFPFKLQEVTTFHLDAALGPAPAYTVMNKDSYAKLPEKAQKAIDSLSGENFSRRMGNAAHRMEDEGRKLVGRMPNQTIAKLDPAEAARWKRLFVPITEHWVKSTPNGAAVLAAYRAEIAKAEAEFKR